MHYILLSTMLFTGALLSACGQGDSSLQQPENALGVKTVVVDTLSSVGVIGENVYGSSELQAYTVNPIGITTHFSKQNIRVISVKVPDPHISIINLSGKACFDEVTNSGAPLLNGQSCTLEYVVNAPNKEKISGNIVVTVEGMSGLNTLEVPVNTDIVAGNEISNGALVLAKTPDWVNGKTVCFMLNHNGATEDLIDTVYVDLSKLPDDLFSAIDISSIKGDYYDENSKRIYIRGLSYGETRHISFNLKANSEGTLFSYYAQLISNASSKYIKIAAANAKATHPNMQASINPIEVDEITISESGKVGKKSMTLTNKANVALTIVDISGLPEGVVVVDKSSTISANDSGKITLCAESNAKGSSNASISYTDSSGVSHSKMVKVSVNNVTNLKSNLNNFRLFAPLNADAPSIEELTLTNIGAFDMRMPKDINQVLYLSATSATSSGLSICSVNCSGKLLKPRDTCSIKIVLNNPKAPADTYTLNILSYQNVSAANLSTFTVMVTNNVLQAEVLEWLPKKIDTSKAGHFTAKLKNISKENITLSKVIWPDKTNARLESPAEDINCFNADGIGLVLSPQKSCILSYNMIANRSGENVLGDIKVLFSMGSKNLKWTSDNVDMTFVETSKLPSPDSAMNVETIVMQPGAKVEIKVTNKFQNSGLQRLSLDLSQFPKDLRAKIDTKSITGGTYDPNTWTVTYKYDLQKTDNHIFSFKLQENASDALLMAYEALRRNTGTHQLALTSVNSQTYYPVITITNITPIIIDSRDLQYTLPEGKSVNLTNKSSTRFKLKYESKLLPKGISIDKNASTCKDDLDIKDSCTYSLTASEHAYGTGKLALTFTDGNGQVFADDVKIGVDNVTIGMANPNRIQVFPPTETQQVNTINVLLQNTGKFDWQLPNTWDDGFSLSDTAGNTLDDREGLKITSPTQEEVKPCIQGGVLPANHNCALGIESSNPNITREYYYLNVLAATNVKATQFSFEVSSSTSSFSVNAQTLISLPKSINQNEVGVYQAKITNKGNEKVMIKGFNLANIDGDLLTSDKTAVKGLLTLDKTAVKDNCFNGNSGKELAQNESCTLNLTANGKTGDRILGDLRLSLSTSRGTISLLLDYLNSYFITEDKLPQSLIVSNTVSFATGGVVTLNIRNNSTDTTLNHVYVDLSSIPQTILDQIDMTNLVGGTWDTVTKRITLLQPISASTASEVSFNLRDGKDTEIALTDNCDKLNRNVTEKVLGVKSSNARYSYPIIAVSPTMARFENLQNIDMPGDRNVYLYNLSNMALKLNIEKSLAPLHGVTVDELSGCFLLPNMTLAGGQRCTIKLNVKDDAYGSGELTAIVKNSLSEANKSEGSRIKGSINVSQVILSIDYSIRSLKNPSPKVIDITIENKGPFSWQTKNIEPTDLVSLDTTAVADGLSITKPESKLYDSCGSTNLALGQRCTFGIASSKPTRAPGSYTLTVKRTKNSDKVAQNITV